MRRVVAESFRLGILCVLCFAGLISAHAEGAYHIRHLSERELLQTYTDIMHDSWRYSDKFWHDWTVEQGAGYWGSGSTENMNEGVRSISDVALTSAVLLKYTDALNASERVECHRKLLAALRYVTATHISGPKMCTNGKHWGNSWQSPMWTGNLAFAAWMVWGDLDDSLRKDVERITAYEADRFLAEKPPVGDFNDTKAEENGWDLTCIAIASAMFTNNPHANAWRTKAIEFAMNTLSAPQDAKDETVVDGKPTSEWYCGANVHPDFTLENHGFFHPGYIGCSSYFMTQTEMYYTFAHQPVPEAATHHLLDEWHMYQGIILPNGEAACPQGMDWELHGLPYENLFASLACHHHDALAARMETHYVQYVREWQQMCNGDMALPGCPFDFVRHVICAEEATFGFLAHKIFGPACAEMSARDAAKTVDGVRLDKWVQVVTQRTRDKFVSFSWTNRVMGMVIPIGPGHEGNPDFTVPIVNGFVGGFDLGPRTDSKPSVVEHAWKKTDNGFETTGTLLLNGGRLKQTLRMTSIGDKAVVYEDRVTALADVTVAQEKGVPIAVENDAVTGGKRTLFSQDDRTEMDWRKPRYPMAISGNWANVDGRLGMVMVEGSGLNYAQATDYHRGITVYEDILYGSHSNHPRQFKKGQEVAHRVVLVFLEVSPKETAEIAKSVRVERKADGKALQFAVPGERDVEMVLF